MNNLLTIRSTPLRLQQRAPLGEYSITQPKAQLDIQKKDSEIQVETIPTELTMDHRAMFDSMGIHFPDNFRRKNESEAKDRVMKAIEEMVLDGHQMMVTYGKAYSEICWRKFDGDPVRLEEVHIPSAKPEINWRIGKVNLSATEFVMNLNWTVHTTANIEYQRRNPEISVAQWHRVDIAYNYANE